MIIQIEINCKDFETAEYFLEHLIAVWKHKVTEPVEDNRTVRADLQRPFGHVASVINGVMEKPNKEKSYPNG
jgi:hypothetical protein